MQKKTKLQFRLPDFFVTLLCVLAAAFFFFLFWKDLNATTRKRDGQKPIAYIHYKYKVAQRKFEDRVVWERVAQNTKLYNGDVIRTADLSKVTIYFDDGTSVELAENTMVQIYMLNDGSSQISIDDGDIQVESSASSQNVEVKLGDGSRVNVNAGASLAATSNSKGGTNNVEVLAGSVQVTTEKGETELVSFGESVSIEKDAGIQKKPVTVTFPPKEYKVLNTKNNESVPVRLEWKTASESNETVIVQTSRTKEFSKIESKFTVNDRNFIQLQSNGILYWKVFSEGLEDKSSIGKITVESVKTIENVSPSASGEFRYRTDTPRITFRWTGNDYVEHYRLRVSSSPDMQSEVVEIETSDTFASVSSLHEGQWWWQVTPFYAINNLGYQEASNTSAFNILKEDNIRPPELAVPAEATNITYKGNPSINFMWKSELKDASYTLLVAKDSKFADVVYSLETESTRVLQEFTNNSLADGTYYWKVVRSAYVDDDLTPESDVRSFTVARALPQENKLLYPQDNFSSERAVLQDTQFIWKISDDYYLIDSNAQSVLQFSDTQDFSNIILEEYTSNSFYNKLSLKEGSYWWRVGVQTNGSSASGFTQPRHFTVLSELAPPVVTTPSVGQELVVFGGSSVSITWNGVDGADFYSVKIFNAKDELVAEKNNVASTSTQFALQQGSYVCRLQAIANETANSALRQSNVSFRPFYVRAPEPVSLVSPANDESFAGLTALRQPITFSWQNGKDASSSYTFVLSKLSSNGSYRTVETTTTTKTSITMQRLTSGTYSWSIRSSSTDGLPLDSEKRTFVIHAVPSLPVPVLTEPEESYVIGPTYLRNNRAITFKWNVVQGANAYRFTLYKKETNGSLKAIYEVKNTSSNSVTIKDLSILDVGQFAWSVAAYSYARDGYEEQSGKASTSSFSIDFSAPNKVEAVKPGAMYGE